MLRKNKKGFTLIELIISIGIIAICGTMLILGIFNMINLFSEGSQIKTNTNTIYNNIVSKIGASDLTYTDSYTLTLKKGATTININSFSDISDKMDSPSLIKLSYLDPKLKASKLPGDIEEPEEPVDAPYGAKIAILKDINHLPTTYDRFTKNHYSDDGYYGYNLIMVNNCIIQKGTIGKPLFGPSVKLIVANNPESDYKDEAYNKLSADYKAMLGTSYSIRYTAMVDYSETDRNLYCYFAPNQKGIYVNYFSTNVFDNEKVRSVWIPWSTDKNVINNAIPKHLNTFQTTGIDSTVKTYTRDELLSLLFVKDFESKETFFSFFGS